MAKQLIFNSDGTLTDDAQLACALLKIDPETLKQRPIDYFADNSTSETIKQIRYQHYEEKRRGKIELIEGSLKSGLLQQLVGTGSLTHSPNNKANMNTMNAYQNNYRAGSAQGRPEIPLREPLDLEFKMHRQIARQAFRKENEMTVKALKDKI